MLNCVEITLVDLVYFEGKVFGRASIRCDMSHRDIVEYYCENDEY